MYEKIILITRKTRLEELIERFNTRQQAQFYIEHSGGNFSLYEQEHETYYAALKHLRRSLQGLLRLQLIERSFLPNFLFAATDLIVTIGIDGLVVNTAKYLSGQPLVAVNPDPAHIDGVLLPFTVGQAADAVQKTMRNQAVSKKITMAQAQLNDGQQLLAFNDFFIGRHDHISARYRILQGSQHENQSSSGVLVSTGVGSTGWLSSVFNMANGLAAQFGDGTGLVERPLLPWESDQLVFVVREPFVSKTSGAGLVCGRITSQSPLVLQSTMPDGGVIFSDGVLADYIAFNAGAVVTITVAQQKINFVIE